MKTEPTLTTVITTLETVISDVKQGFKEVSNRFERVEGLIGTLVAQQDNLLERVVNVERQVSNLVVQVAGIQDTILDISAAEEKDAEASINHELRIRYLEKMGKIKSIPPRHLARIKTAR